MMETSLSKINSQVLAIDVRRGMLYHSDVVNALSMIERAALEASVKTQIANMSDEDLLVKATTLSKYIAKDVGIRGVDDYQLSRFVNLLKTYYSMLSMQEVRLAFEMSIAGELDEYLPLDKNGNPDKSHYQTFNAEYISKILNAYKKRRQNIEHKAYTALPKMDMTASVATKDYYLREIKKMVIHSYFSYKYRGNIPDNSNLYIMYSELDKIGLAEPINVTEADKKEAVARLLKKSHTGILKEFIAECIRRQQTKHTDVISEAGLIAKEKALLKSFDRMVRDEVQIQDYIK